MKSKSFLRPVGIAAALVTIASASVANLEAAEVALPAVHGKKIVAKVNGEPITLEEYGKEFAAVHATATESAKVRKMDPADLLERMIKTRLVVQEAETMGLDTLPEVRKALEFFEQETMRNFLFGEHLRTVKKPDPKEVDKVYKELVKEAKLSSVRFDKKEDAESFRSAIEAGGDFRGLAARAAGEGKAKGSDKGTNVKLSDVPPEMAGILSGLKPGQVSPVIATGNKYTVLKVEAIRFPESKEKRKQAANEALQRKRSASLRKYVGSLEKKHVKYDKKLVKEIDFEAEAPGFANLLADERPVAWIAGENPVTVKDWTEALQKEFFHGVDEAIKKKRLNKRKDLVLDQIVSKKAVLREAKRRRIDQLAGYREMVAEYRTQVLFGTFVQKVVDPESRTSEEELKAYLQEHITDFTVPEAMRLGLLVFNTREDAEEAIAKLRAGADFQWMRANATGQADPSAVKQVMEIDGKLVYRFELPDELKQAVAGAAAGDLRLHGGREGLSYVVVVQEVVPSRPEDYETAKDRLSERVFKEKRVKVLEGWMEKLRSASRVEIYAKGEQIRRLMEIQNR